MVEHPFPEIKGPFQTLESQELLEHYMGNAASFRDLETILENFLWQTGRYQQIAQAPSGTATLLVQALPDYFRACRRELRKRLRGTPLHGKDLFTRTVLASIFAYRKDIPSTVVQPIRPHPANDVALAYPEDQRIFIYSLNGGKYYHAYDTVPTSAIVERLGSMPLSSPIITF